MQEIKNVVEKLADQIDGDVLSSDLSRSLYSSGASLYRIKPRAVVQPKSKEDLVKTVRFAQEYKIPITARGGGTSRTGNELGKGLVLDFSKHLNQVVKFNEIEKWVRVQPGIVLSELNQFLKPYKLYFPIDPSTKDSATLGGMIANNSSGPHAVKYGTTRGHVTSLELVLSNGEIVETGPKSLVNKSDSVAGNGRTFEDNLYRNVPIIITNYSDYLEAERPFTTKNSCGYHIWDLITEETIDLTPLLVGSEGNACLWFRRHHCNFL